MTTKVLPVIYGGNVWLKTDNLALSLAKAKMPDLKRAMSDINASGSYFGLQIPAEIEALTAEFEVNGPDKRVRIRFGRDPGDWTELYYYERIREVVAGVDIGRTVYLKGLINEIDAQETEKTKAAGTMKFRMSTIVHYHDRQDGRTTHKFDYFTNTVVVDGVDLTSSHNQILAW
ncbi:hypothetical protein C2U72_22385 [Prosthecomicrobium hirschii]|uniref:phage major tail tube protein n=1 Tax=Prosthecodimorpha hirschii TaxID=665126 RepID=UPI0011289FC1|nr:phage major tail tube protein [Prosthecomicrobium hirschii]TPQ48695.1 hypothetical protein C2U72_22385 [Prosthecomicrobium hirschii]